MNFPSQKLSGCFLILADVENKVEEAYQFIYSSNDSVDIVPGIKSLDSRAIEYFHSGMFFEECQHYYSGEKDKQIIRIEYKDLSTLPFDDSKTLKEYVQKTLLPLCSEDKIGIKKIVRSLSTFQKLTDVTKELLENEAIKCVTISNIAEFLHKFYNNDKVVKELIYTLTDWDIYWGAKPEIVEAIKSTEYYQKQDIPPISEWKNMEYVDALHYAIASCSDDLYAFNIIRSTYFFQEIYNQNEICRYINSLKNKPDCIQKFIENLVADPKKGISDSIIETIKSTYWYAQFGKERFSPFNLLLAKNSLYNASRLKRQLKNLMDVGVKKKLLNEINYLHETGLQNYVQAELELLKYIPSTKSLVAKLRIENLTSKIIEGLTSDTPYIDIYQKAYNSLKSISPQGKLRLNTPNKSIVIKVYDEISLFDLWQLNSSQVIADHEISAPQVIQKFVENHNIINQNFIVPKSFFHAVLDLPDKLTINDNLLIQLIHDYMNSLGYSLIPYHIFKSNQDGKTVVNIIAENQIFYKNQYHAIGTSMNLLHSQEIIACLEKKYGLMKNIPNRTIRENVNNHLKTNTKPKTSQNSKGLKK